MANVEFELDLTPFERKLKKLPNLPDKLVGVVTASTLTLQNRLANYPAPPPDSTYRRTGTLGRRWTQKVQRRRGSVIGTIGNNTEYAEWVQGFPFSSGRPKYQAKIHQGRWLTLPQAIEDEQESFERRALQIVNQELNR